MYGLAGNATTVKPGCEYAHTSALFDVTKENNDWFNRAQGRVLRVRLPVRGQEGLRRADRSGHPDCIGAF